MRLSLLARFAPLVLFVLLPCLLVDPALTAPQRSEAEGSTQKRIALLIQDLQNDSFERREAATKALMELEDEPPELHGALKSSDLEVRRRAARIHAAFTPKRARRALAKVPILAKEGRIDEMIERLVVWKEWDKGQGWKVLAAWLARLAEHVDRTYGKTHFQRLAKRKKKTNRQAPTHYKDLTDYWQKPVKLIREDQFVFNPRQPFEGDPMVISSGDVKGSGLCGIILAGGNVQLSSLLLTVIICDGDCEVRGDIADSLIIARGKVTCPQSVNWSVILSEASIHIPERGNLYKSVMSDGWPNGLVKFFDPADVGLAVHNVMTEQGRMLPDAGTWIARVRQGTPFASGLLAKDVVSAIDETKTPSAEIFRKVLRRKLAEGGPTISFTVQRLGKTLEVPIAVKD